jgi:hypothetical protein
MNAWRLIKTVKDWPVASQQAARRNALVASTTLTRLRIERAEIDAFVDAAAARHEVRANRAAAAQLA